MSSTLKQKSAGPDGSGIQVAFDPSATEKATTIVDLAAGLMQLKSRINSLDALGEFASALSRDLDDAVKRDAFCYFYQPIVSTVTGHIEGHEALIRWQGRGEAIVPALFLPIMEENGSIQSVQQRLLDDVARACGQSAAPTFIGINWSPRQLLQASAASALIDRVKELKLDPARIIIEITTRSTLIDADLIFLCVQLLKESGFQIALDDFGGPIGGLSYLNRLPIDVVKLDSSLIADAERSERAARILAGIIDFAHQLRARVIANGVETQQQVRILRRLGCDLLQGQAIGSPIGEPKLLHVGV